MWLELLIWNNNSFHLYSFTYSSAIFPAQLLDYEIYREFCIISSRYDIVILLLLIWLTILSITRIESIDSFPRIIFSLCLCVDIFWNKLSTFMKSIILYSWERAFEFVNWHSIIWKQSFMKWFNVSSSQKSTMWSNIGRKIS